MYPARQAGIQIFMANIILNTIIAVKRKQGGIIIKAVPEDS